MQRKSTLNFTIMIPRRLILKVQDITKTRLCNILRILMAVKNNKFQLKNIVVFLIFAKNIKDLINKVPTIYVFEQK